MTTEWVSDCGNYKLIHGDSIMFLSTMQDCEFASVVTDPPYGIDYCSLGSLPEQCGWDYCEWDRVRIGREYFDEIRRVSKTQIIWGGNYYTDYLPPTMQWLIWDKGQREFRLADCEIAWSSNWKASRVLTYGRWLGNREQRFHATQKPIAVMDWCISFCPPGPILDPFCGSASTIVAAYRAGIPAVGIEAEKAMFEVAVSRMRSEMESVRHPLLQQKSFLGE